MPRFLKWLLTTICRAAWAPILVVGLHAAASLILDIYTVIPPLDIPMHVLGGVAVTYFAAHSIRAARELDLLGAPNATAERALAFTTGCTAAVLWEFAEFLSDRYLGTTSQGGLEDTLSDLFLGICGALVYVSWAWLDSSRRSPRNPARGNGGGRLREGQR